MRQFFITLILMMSHQARAAPVQLMVSVLWEGLHLRQGNLDALRELRKSWPHLHLSHFVSPAYFLGDLKTVEHASRKVAEAILPGEPVGLYLHPWVKLLKRVGIAPRRGASFWGGETSLASCGDWCGHDTPLTLYRSSEIAAMLAEGSYLVRDVAGLELSPYFLAGGWVSSSAVTQALVAEKFTYDFSSRFPDRLGHGLDHYPLKAWLVKMWAGREHSEHRQSVSGKVLNQIAHVPGPLEHHSLDEVLGWLTREAPEGSVAHVSIYQETSRQTLPRLEGVLSKVHQLPHRVAVTGCRPQLQW